MLAVRALHFSLLHQSEAPEQVKLVQETTINAGQPFVATPINQALVKPEIERVIAIEIISLSRCIHRFHQRPQLVELLCRKPAGGTPGGQFFQSRIDIMYLECLFQIDFPHKRATVLFGSQQTKVFQGMKSVSNGTAADAEALSDLLFGQFLAGREFAVKNPFGHRPFDPGRERIAFRSFSYLVDDSVHSCA